ncbi:MAG: hypothetical protein ACYDBJ_17030 [Aggregatilineales bacterium]
MDENDELLPDFLRACVDRLADNLIAAFGDRVGPLDEMLAVARETAVVIAIEMRLPPMADPLYQIFERAISEAQTASKPDKRAKRRRQVPGK